MKYLFICFMFIVAGCNSQSGNKPAVTDTAKLFDPHPETYEEGAKEMHILKRNISLIHPGYYITTFNDEYKPMKKTEEVEKFVRDNSDAIRKSKFYIIIDSNTSFSKTKSVIDIFLDNKIDDYKVLNYQQFLNPDIIKVTAPTVKHTIQKKNDSTWLIINVLDTGFETKLAGKETKLKNLEGLDTFINSNKPGIGDISIKIAPATKAGRFKEVADILNKNGYTKFTLVSQ
jgi:biopolymer transport protein ExbD